MKKLTPKQRVLKVHPTAREMYDENWNPIVGMGLRCILGEGKTHLAAWAVAARQLRKNPSKQSAAQTPSEMLRQAVVHLRRAAIAQPKFLPIAQKIERIADEQAEYERKERP